MKKIRKYWQGIVLGLLANFAVVAPTLADTASDQRGMFSVLLPIFIAVVAVAYTVYNIRNHRFKSLFAGILVGGVAFVVSLFLVGLL